jgi:hypothetical protein
LCLYFVLNKQLKILINYWLGPILFIWIGYSIYKQIQQHQDVAATWQNIQLQFKQKGWVTVSMVIICMFLNWGLEARKWQLLMQAIQPITYRRAIRAIFSGQALALSTPNRIGEFAGRVVYLNDGNKLRGLSLSAVGSLAQMLVTFIFGSLGLLFIYHVIDGNNTVSLSKFWLKALISLIVVISIFIGLFYYNLSWCIRLFEKIPFIHKYKFFIEKLEDVDAAQLTKILFFSGVRYVVYLYQYILMLQFFDVQVAWWIMCCLICTHLLITAIVPSIALAELGVRAKVIVALFSTVSNNIVGVVATAAGIWMINLIFPALAGSLMILGVRIFRK